MNTQYENTESTTSAFDAELEALVSALETKWAAERAGHKTAEAQQFNRPTSSGWWALFLFRIAIN